jgi:16S rRNA (adenine1518-N6/adenine1519-N6)-dimethyltransferase
MGARREARAALAAAGLRPRRRWGQHFLCDPGVARRIVDTAEVGSGSAVLEIGPGLGALTDVLAARAARLYLVEIDPALAERLRDRFAAIAHVEVLAGDALTLPLDDLVPEPRATVVANLPYNVAIPILFRLLSLRTRFPRAVLMVQREVAERLVAPPGSSARGVTSVLVQTFADVRLAFGVSRRSFLPPPRVESAVVDIRWSPVPRVDVGAPEVYQAAVRAAFGKRRKTLRNALAEFAGQLGVDRASLAVRLAASGIDPGARAETLDLTAFARLARAFTP